MGTLGVAPVFPPPPRTGKDRTWRRTASAVACVALFGLLTTSALFRYLRAEEQSYFQAQFKHSAETRNRLLQDRLEANLLMAASVSRYMEATRNPTQEDFSSFAAPLVARCPEVLAVEWIPAVPLAQRDPFNAQWRRSLANGFQIFELDSSGQVQPASQRSVYYPVLLAAPLKPSERAVGYDLGSSAPRLEALMRARDTGQPAVTERLHLVQRQANTFGLFLAIPVYSAGARIESISQRQAALRGFVLAVFDADAMYEATFENVPPAGFTSRLLDLSAPPDRNLLTFRSSRFQLPITWKQWFSAPPPHYLGAFSYGGRNWALALDAVPSYMQANYAILYWLILPAGVLTTFFFSLYLYFILHRREILERAVAVHTAALSESESLFRNMFDRHDSVMLLVEPTTGNILRANAAAEAYCRFPPGVLLQLNLDDFNTNTSAEMSIRRAAASSRRVSCFDSQYRLADGEVRDVEVHTSPIPYQGREVLFSIVNDVTERRRIEESLRIANERFELALRNSTVSVFSQDLELRHTWSAKPILGHAISDLIGKRDTDLFESPADAAITEAIKRDVILTGSSRHQEVVLHRSAGDSHYDLLVDPLRDSEGRIVGVTCAVIDITSRKLAEAAQREAHVFLQATIDALSSNICVLDESGNIISVNRAWREFATANQPCASGSPVEHAYYEQANYLAVCDVATGPDADEAGRIAAGIRAVLAGESERFSMEYPCHSPSEQRWFSCRVSRFANQHPTRVAVEHISITDRILAEAALRESEVRFRALFEHNMDAVLLTQPLGTIVAANAAACAMFNATEKELCGMGNSLVDPEDPRRALSLEERARTGKFRGELTLVRKDGSKFTGELTSLILPGGNSSYVLLRDITDRIRSEAALRDSEARFRAVLDNSHDAIYRFNLQTDRFEYMSPSVESIIGYTPAEFLALENHEFIAMVHPDDRLAGRAALQQVTEHGHSHVEYRHRAKSGEYRWLSARMTLTFDDAGRPLHRYGNVHDITRRKLAEEALRETEARFRAVLENSTDAAFRYNELTDRFDYMSPSIEAMTGRTPEEALGQADGDFLDMVHPDDRPAALAAFETLHASGRAEFEYRHQSKSGEYRWLSTRLSRTNDAEGRPLYRYGNIRDITAQKQAEAEQARLLQGIEQVSDSVVMTGLDGTILYVNPAFEKITGYTRAEALGCNPRMLKSDRQPVEFYEELWATLLRGETWSGNLVNKRKDGGFYTEVATISPVKDAGGNVVNFVAVKRDITDELLTREQLNRVQKLESVGRLSGGIAHEFNNLLMVIQAHAELMSLHIPGDEYLRHSTEKIVNASRTGAGLTARMLAFSHSQLNMPVVLDLAGTVGEMLTELEHLVGERIALRIQSQSSPCSVKVDPNHLAQVLIDLCENARDAMPAGGTLTIATSTVSVQQGSVSGHPYILPGNYAALTLTDTGIGMSRQTLQQVFEPFFTTKEVGQGTGLGLATVYGIVRQADGYIWAESEPGKGACFTVFLPLVAPAAPATLPLLSTASKRGTETLLIAEDEDSLRSGIEEFLVGLGYNVLAAASGEQALALAAAQPRIHLLLTDIVMPGINGWQLSQALAAERPDLKIIYMSGFSSDSELGNDGRVPDAAIFTKPFRLAALASRIRESLDGVELVQ